MNWSGIGWVVDLLVTLFRCYSESAEPQQYHMIQLVKMLQFMKNNLHRKITLDEIAKAGSISVTARRCSPRTHSRQRITAGIISGCSMPRQNSSAMRPSFRRTAGKPMSSA